MARNANLHVAHLSQGSISCIECFPFNHLGVLDHDSGLAMLPYCGRLSSGSPFCFHIYIPRCGRIILGHGSLGHGEYVEAKLID